MFGSNGVLFFKFEEHRHHFNYMMNYGSQNLGSIEMDRVVSGDRECRVSMPECKPPVIRCEWYKHHFNFLESWSAL